MLYMFRALDGRGKNREITTLGCNARRWRNIYVKIEPYPPHLELLECIKSLLDLLVLRTLSLYTSCHPKYVLNNSRQDEAVSAP
jgi:hypothetical protein